MTTHPNHRLRVILWSIDHEGRPRISAQHGFIYLSSAVAFQMEALAKQTVVRADLMLLLNSSTKSERGPVPTVPAE